MTQCSHWIYQHMLFTTNDLLLVFLWILLSKSKWTVNWLGMPVPEPPWSPQTHPHMKIIQQLLHHGLWWCSDGLWNTGILNPLWTKGLFGCRPGNVPGENWCMYAARSFEVFFPCIVWLNACGWKSACFSSLLGHGVQTAWLIFLSTQQPSAIK